MTSNKYQKIHKIITIKTYYILVLKDVTIRDIFKN